MGFNSAFKGLKRALKKSLSLWQERSQFNYRYFEIIKFMDFACRPVLETTVPTILDGQIPHDKIMDTIAMDKSRVGEAHK